MNKYYADLHIHIGSAQGRPVKITASRALQLRSLLYQYAPSKGLDIVGVVDAACLPVSRELEEMLERDELREHSQGGFIAKNGILLAAASEIETREGTHMITFLPTWSSISTYQRFLGSRVKNLSLSTQRCSVSIKDLINLQYIVGGFLCPAHVFTPHKGVYGCCTDRLESILGRDYKSISCLELGLSANTDMGDLIKECSDFTFLSNSDAHSPANVGREYNLLRMGEKSFRELKLCLENQGGRKVLANFGMDPLMGKYHRSYCPECNTIIHEAEAIVSSCPYCSGAKLVTGVYDRIMEIRDFDTPHHPFGRPPYYCRVPLHNLPGVSKQRAEKLAALFGSEIELMEKAEISRVEKMGGGNLAIIIRSMREGRLPVIPGGGGFYGKVRKLRDWPE